MKLKTGAGKGRAAGMIQGMETKTQAKMERSYGYAAVNRKLNLWLWKYSFPEKIIL